MAVIPFAQAHVSYCKYKSILAKLIALPTDIDITLQS